MSGLSNYVSTPIYSSWLWIRSIKKTFQLFITTWTTPPPPPSPAPGGSPHSSANFSCFICFRGFNSKQGLASHLARTHNFRNNIASRIDSSTCPCCHKRSLYRYLNLRHIQNSKRCTQYVMTNCDILAPELLKLAIEQDNKVIRSNVRSGLPKLYAHDK